MVAIMGGMPIKSFFCSLSIILYIILFGQINRISFLLALNPNHFSTMSFSTQRAVHYLVDQFQYCLLIGYIKTVAVLKCQQFEDSKNEKMELRVSK